MAQVDSGQRRAPVDILVRPFKIFAQNKLAGAILLLGATVVALAWANSPWHHSYHDLLHVHLSVDLGGFVLDKTLHHWINDGLMGIFFFVIGLEIKREVIAGELSDPRRAALPIVAAIGGMAVPAGVYVVANLNGGAIHGWGVPTATDIAFALGVLALLGDRVPIALKVFLTALAIVDDILAVLVIALFYSDGISMQALIAGLGFCLTAAVFNRIGVRRTVPYLLLGLACWLCFLESGVHATLSAVLMALTIPSRAALAPGTLLSRLKPLLNEIGDDATPSKVHELEKDQQHALEEASRLTSEAVPPLQRLEHGLMPLVTFVVMPVFALANAGVHLSGSFGDAIFSAVGLGIVLGLFVGKQLGITLFAFLAVKLGIAVLPGGSGWRQVHAVAVLGGIGFTMSLFVASLAFSDPVVSDSAKLAILVGSVLSAVTGYLLLRRSPGGRR